MSVKVKDVLDALQQMQKSLECSICLELLKDPHSTKCNHQFCGHCIRQVLEKSSKKSKNKWYCPLCKTPVSKRSLTPNPKLSEIVAAVRNLQGAVQDDTGIPTGSPPSQPFKSHSTGCTSDVSHVSNLQPTSQKCVTGCRGKQNASRKNQFSVYIDNNENAEKAMESKQPQVVSNINIRSSLRPLSVTQTISKNTKSNKVINTKTTRRTRNSKRILAQKGHLEDIDVRKNGNEELLHMIDTMAFKPVCNAVAGSSKDFILDPSTLESKPDLISVLSLDSSTSTKTVSTVKDGTGSKGTSLGTSVQQEITTCLTTIAEADSSIRTSPSGASAGLFGNKISLHDENTANSKNNEGAVSSSKIESVLLSSLDTMQSVSILSSLDCAVALGVCDDSRKEDNNDNITYQSDEQNKLISIERCNLEKQEKPYDAAHDNACNENLGLDKCLNKDIDFQIQCNEGGKLISTNISDPETHEQPCVALRDDTYSGRQEVDNHINEVITYQGDEGNKLTSTNLCDPKIHEKPFEMCEEMQTCNHQRLSEPVDATVPSERDLTEQSLDFEGLVSLFDDPSHLNKPQEAMQQEETLNSSPRLGQSAELLQQARTVNEKIPFVKPMESLQQAITLNTNPSLSSSEKGKIPPSSKADMQVNETTDPSDLCERVKQRQRRRTFEMPLTSKRYSDSPKRSRSEQKPLKRSANYVIDFKTRDGPSPEGSAKKRFKASEDPLPGQASPMMANTAREKTGGVIGVYSEQLQQENEGTMTAKGDRWTCVDELGVDSYSCSSGKTVNSNEVIPASVSSSGNSNSAAINPMIVYANQTSEENQGGARRRKDKWSSQIKQIEEDNHKNNTGKRISIDDYPPNLVTRKKSSQDEKRNNVESKDEGALNDEESSTDFTRSQQLSACLSQNPFVCVTDLQSNCSKQIGFKGKERKAAQLEDDDTIRENVSQRLKTGEIAESQSFDPCEKALFNDSSQFKEDGTTEARQVDIDDDIQVQGNIFISSQNSSQRQKHLINSPCSNLSGDSENDGQIKGKCPGRVAVDSGAKTSEPLSQEAHNSNSTPTQSSLEVDALTPCLFGNDSWETPEKKVSQKRSRISKPLREEIIKNNDYSEADFERMRTLDDSKARDAEQHISGVVSQSPASNTKEVTSDVDPEGTQSFGTSQSISVLHDLEFPAQEQQESTIRNEEHSCHSAENSNAEAKSDNSWAEPLPKKSRSGQQSESQEVDSNVSFKHLSCPNIEKPHGSDCTESDVIPPTPPVKLATKHVFGSDAQSPFRMLRAKIKPQRKDEADCYSERLAVKKKKRIRSPRCSKSPRLQDNKDDGAITHCSSVGSEMNEASVSLLENHPRSVNAEAKGLHQAMELEFDTDLSLKSKRMKSSQDRNTETAVNNSGVIPNKSPKGLTRFSKSGKKRHVVEHVSLPKLDEPRYSQRKTDSQVSQNVRQIHVHEDLKDSPSSQVESVNSSPCSPVKQRVDHVGDSFDWSETRDTLKGNGDSQSDPITFDNGDDEEDEHLTGGEDEDCCSALLNSPRASQACHEVEDKAEYTENPIIGNVRNMDSLSVVDKGDSIFTDDDKGESSGDEALLKPVFLPKESESLASESSCKEDAHDNAEEVEVAVFSQELIPSENDDDNGDGISSSYKALDSTGASSATFLSETAASTQKMDVLREDVEAMEKEMEELRAYLATTDENREGAENTIGDDNMDYEEADEVDDADVQPSLTPPPPLTPKSIPPMRQLSTPLKDVSRYLDQEGQSSDESSECEGAKSNEPVKRSELRRSSCYEGHKRNTDKNDSMGKTANKRPFSPSYEDDCLSITPVEQRREETPSPPHSSRSTEKSQEKDEDQLIVIDDRDALHSKTASLLLGKRRKLVHDLVPRKSPVVSLLFTRAGKDSEKTSQSPQPVMQPAMRKSSPFIYSRKRCSTISPIRGQDPPRTVSRERVSREVVTGESASRDNVSCDRLSSKSVSRDSVSHNSMSPERESYDQCYSPDLVVTKVKDLTNKKYDKERENRTSARHMSFVATRLNRQQLAEARTLAETYGGKLASEFNSKTSHVIMATDENMQVTRHSYTMKYLLGLALGKWIVSHRWIAACKEAKTLIPEADYEVKGDSGLGQNSIPRVARTARNNKETLLFEDFDVLCCGGFSTAVTKEQLSQLLKFCGAQVYLNADNLKRTEKGRQKVVIIDKETRDNVNEIKAICRQLNTKPVSLEWVTDSIANYKVQDLRDYIVEL